MKRTLASQSMHTLLSMVGNQMLQISAGIAISRVYGPAGKGAVTYAGIAVLGVVAIADGLGSAIARQCGTDPERLPAARAAALRIIAVVSAVGMLALCGVGWFVPAQRALLYVGLAFPFALYVQTMSSFYLMAGRVERTNAAAIAINAGAALVMLLATVLIHPPIDAILGIWSGGYVVGAAIIYAGLRTPALPRADARSVEESLAIQLRFAVRSSSAALMTFLASRIDVFIVAATLSATALGNYTLALAVGELMWQVGRALSWSAYGRVATLGFGEAASLTAKITRIVLAVELVAAVIAFCAGPAVLTFVYGTAFAAAGPVLRILLVGMALYAGDAILSYFLAVKAGRPGLILAIEAVTLAVCAAGSLLTVTRFGIAGPAIATTLAYCVSFAIKAVLFANVSGVSVETLLVIRPSDLRTTAAQA